MTTPELPEALVARFEVKKTTQNTVVFAEIVPISADPSIPTLYIRKDAVRRLGHPERLKVTIEVDDFEPYPKGRPVE